MEDSKQITRFFIGVLALPSAYVLVLCVWCGSLGPLLPWLMGVVAFIGACVMIAAIQIAVFGPMLWLLSRLFDGRPGAVESRDDSQ